MNYVLTLGKFILTNESVRRNSYIISARRDHHRGASLNKLLIIDDSDTQHELFRCYAMTSQSVELLHATSMDEAVDIIETLDPDIVFLDNQLLPYRNCGQTLPRIRDTGFEGKVVVISSDINSNLISMAKTHAVDGIADKCDFNLANFGSKVEHYLQ